MSVAPPKKRPKIAAVEGSRESSSGRPISDAVADAPKEDLLAWQVTLSKFRVPIRKRGASTQEAKLAVRLSKIRSAVLSVAQKMALQAAPALVGMRPCGQLVDDTRDWQKRG